jgi:hypothetical protein
LHVDEVRGRTVPGHLAFRDPDRCRVEPAARSGSGSGIKVFGSCSSAPSTS